MKKKFYLLVGSFALFFLLGGIASFANAQERTKKVIELKIGISVTGYVLEMNDGGYMLETDSGDIIFYSRDEIRSIRNPSDIVENNENADPALRPDGSKTPVNIVAQENTLESLLRYYRIQEKLKQFWECHYRKDKKQAEAIEDELWEIEKTVSNNNSIPESVRREFRDYIEDEEDRLEEDAEKARKQNKRKK